MRLQGRSGALAGLAALMTMMLSCEPPSTQAKDAFTRVEHYLAGPQDFGQIKADLLASLGTAKVQIDAALWHLADADIAQALIEARARGVRVRVVSDEDSRGDAGFVALEAAGIVPVYGEGELRYLPDPTLTALLEQCFTPQDEVYIECTRRGGGAAQPGDGLMVRPGDFNAMAHNFFVVDELTVFNLASPLDGRRTYWIGFSAESLEFAQAFTREFQQMHGGVFATTLDTYNGPNKSTVQTAVYDSRIPGPLPGRKRQLQPGFLTDHGPIEIMFNPQERLMKELIDEVYAARGSVYLMTDELLNDFLVDALAYKARFFEVRVLLRNGSRIPEKLRDRVRYAPADFEYIPTQLVLHDFDRTTPNVSPRLIATLTHPTWFGQPFEVLERAEVQSDNEAVRVYPSDLFSDGSLWIMREPVNYKPGPGVSDPYARYAALFNQAWLSATEVQ